MNESMNQSAFLWLESWNCMFEASHYWSPGLLWTQDASGAREKVFNFKAMQDKSIIHALLTKTPLTSGSGIKTGYISAM